MQGVWRIHRRSNRSPSRLSVRMRDRPTADHLSTEEVLQKLADEGDPPVNPDEPGPDPADHDPGESIFPRARSQRRKPRLAVDPEEVARQSFSPQQRLLLLDTWQRSGLSAREFAELVGVSKHTLNKWKQLFERLGPEGLMDRRRARRRGSRLPEVTRRTILMLKQSHPEWGCQRISDALLRGPALSASALAVSRVLHQAGYESVPEPTRPHPSRACRFERARPRRAVAYVESRNM